MNLPFSKSTLRLSASAWLVVGCVLMFFVVSHVARNLVREWTAEQTENYSQRRSSDDEHPQRLIGLAPSNVETLFALGLGKNVVGVNRYSSYPPEALDLPQIGGMADVDFEQLLMLKPDCVVMLDSQSSLLQKFEELGIQTLSVNDESVEGITKSFVKIAEVCGNAERAAEINKEIESHIAAVKIKLIGKDRPRVLVCIHHSTDVSQPEQIVVCGSVGYHRELLEIAGGVNAYQGAVAFPKLSRENLINLNPDIIIDLVNKKVANDRSREALKDLWNVYGELDAVKNRKIVIADGAEHFSPGPRFLRTLDVFVKGIHGVKVTRKSKLLKEFEEGTSQ